MWFFITLGVIIQVALVLAIISVFSAKKIECPRCGHQTRYRAKDATLRNCGDCGVRILENGDGTYRAHAITTKDAS